MNQKSLEQLERAKKIAIFSGLTDERLNEILTHAKIHNCKKNELLFLEGEEVERFYVISDGAMKLAVSDSEGNEAIIRIINSGSICDIFSDNFSFNCQALADSKILSFPIKKFRNFVKENSDLLYNLLLDSSEKKPRII